MIRPLVVFACSSNNLVFAVWIRIHENAPVPILRLPAKEVARGVVHCFAAHRPFSLIRKQRIIWIMP